MLHKLTTVFFLLMAGDAIAQGNLELVNGLWYDGTGFEKKVMYSVDGVFRAAFDGEARALDLGGRYVIPPLADAHNHAFADGANFEEELARFLGAGVFYVKNPNNTLRLTARFRPLVNQPASVDVLYSNGGLTSTGGHPTQIYAELVQRIPDWGAPDMENEAYFLIDTPAVLEAKWARILAGKPDFLKVYLEGKRGVKPAVLDAIVARARAAGLPVSAHVTSAEDFHQAVRAGVNEITHLPLQPIEPADAAAAAKKNITVVTTTLSHRPAPGVSDLAALHRANLVLLKRAGVNVILGVDNHPLVVDELLQVATLGVHTRAELLRMATETTARAIFPKRRIGRLEDGYEASFIALDANPLDDLSAIRKVSVRVKQGHELRIAPPKPGIHDALMPVLMSKGVDAAIAEYHRLEKEDAASWDFAEKHLNQLGYAMIRHGMAAQAIAIFTLNAARYPHSANVWDSLAEAYMLAGERAKAIEYYEKSLTLNPKNENAKAMLQKLRDALK